MLQASGQVIVAASGNHGADLDVDPVFPAALSPAFSHMITVGATEPGGAVAPYSNVGAGTVDVLAPGSLIWSTTTVQRGGYATFSGVLPAPLPFSECARRCVCTGRMCAPFAHKGATVHLVQARHRPPHS